MSGVKSPTATVAEERGTAVTATVAEGEGKGKGFEQTLGAFFMGG